jgi:hypothetical protein
LLLILLRLPQSITFRASQRMLVAAPMVDDASLTEAFRSTAHAVIVPLVQIEPVARFSSVKKDWAGFDRARFIEILSGIAAGSEIPPVPITDIPILDLRLLRHTTGKGILSGSEEQPHRL